MTKITRNEYFNLIKRTGKVLKNEFEILPFDLSAYPLTEATKALINENFVEESTDKKGNYMLKSYWSSGKACLFASKCGLKLHLVDGYSLYAFSDEQLAFFTQCEGDVFLILFTDKAKYEEEKAETIRWYKEEY